MMDSGWKHGGVAQKWLRWDRGNHFAARLATGGLAMILLGCGRETTPTPDSSARAAAEAPAALVAADEGSQPDRPALVTPPAVDANLPVYELRMNLSDLTTLDRGWTANQTVPATFAADGKVYEGVKVRIRGSWSRSWPKKSLKIVFTKDKPFGGQHELNLNSGWRDPAFIREPLAYYVYGACGAITLNARMVRLNVNGKFRGLYVDVEQPGKAFLSRYKLKGASLYKAISRSNQADERDYPNESAFSNHYARENQKTEGFGDLQQFCHDLPVTQAREFFTGRMDLEKYINFLAATVLTQNWDGFNKNHFLVYDGRNSRKWYVLPWDLDRTFGDHWNWSFEQTRLPITLGTHQNPGITGWSRLEDRFLSDPELRGRFLNRLSQLLDEVFTPQKLFPVIDRMEAAIATDGTLDRRNWPSQSPDFHRGIAQVKSFIERRRAYLQQELVNLRGSSGR